MNETYKARLEKLTYKTEMCDNCPHRATPNNTDPEIYCEVRSVIERVRQESLPYLHPCHKDDGHFCAGALSERNGVNNEQETTVDVQLMVKHD